MPGLDAPSGGGSWSPRRISMNGPIAPPKAEQREVYVELYSEAEHNPVEGDIFNLVSIRWWKKWKRFLGEAVEDDEDEEEEEDDEMPNSSPGPINNARLVEPVGDAAESSVGRVPKFRGAEGSTWRLKRNLVEQHDYVLVSVALWRSLYSWYGGGPGITRVVVPMGKQGSFAVEVYPLSLNLILSSAPSHTRTVVLSKKATVQDLELKVCEIFSKTEAEFRLWDNFHGTRHKLLQDLGQTLEHVELEMDNEILIEECGPDGSFSESNADLPPLANSSHHHPEAEKAAAAAAGEVPEDTAAMESVAGVDVLGTSDTSLVPVGSSFSKDADEASTSSGFVSSLRSQLAAQSSGRLRGLAGLVNLGNTCFMNSAIQCLVHTPPLVDFFCNSDYTKEVNRTNPLGMEGEIAMSFGELTQQLWAPGNEPVAPRSFKSRLSRFAPQFSGYNQHDSQELLAFLLDGLHEDLNRVVTKPYIEAKDSEGRSDMEVAAEYWANHLKRNNSFIIHTCQGQFRSTLVCPVCSKVSKTFDPFAHLSLPLPSKTMRPITVTVVVADGAANPCTVTVNVPRTGLVEDLTRQLALQLSLPDSERLVLAEIYQSKVHQVFTPMQQLSFIAEQDRIVAYRVPSGCPTPIFVNQRTRTRPGARLTGAKPNLYPNWVPTGTPFVIPQSRVLVETGEQAYKLVKAALHPFRVKRPARQDSHASLFSPRSEAADEDKGGVTRSRSDKGGRGGRDSPDSERNGAGDMLGDDSSDLASDLASESSMPREGEEDVKTGTGRKGRFSNGFRLKYWRPGGDKEWVEIADTPERLPQQFFIAGTPSGEHQPLALDWAPRTVGEMYDLKLLDDLPIVGGSQPSFWSFGQSSFKQSLPGVDTEKEGISLYTCLDAFLTEEPLGPDDMWYCPKCQEFRQATKKMDLWKLPDILVIHLKRFSYSKYYKNKIDSLVEFPIQELDLTQYVQGRKAKAAAAAAAPAPGHSSTANGTAAEEASEGGATPKGKAAEAEGNGQQHSQDPTSGGEAGAGEEGERYLYNLYAVSNHFGGLGGGHYTAYAKHPDDGNWYCFDDSYVSSTNESHVKSTAAYVLFYQRIKGEMLIE